VIIGIDYFGTIDKYPRQFKKLARAYLAAGYPVYIITAVKPDRVTAVERMVRASRMPYTELEIVTFEDFRQLAHLKLQAARKRGVRLMYEDIQEVCELLAHHGIMTAQIR